MSINGEFCNWSSTKTNEDKPQKWASGKFGQTKTDDENPSIINFYRIFSIFSVHVFSFFNGNNNCDNRVFFPTISDKLPFLKSDSIHQNYDSKSSSSSNVQSQWSFFSQTRLIYDLNPSLLFGCRSKKGKKSSNSFTFSLFGRCFFGLGPEKSVEPTIRHGRCLLVKLITHVAWMS